LAEREREKERAAGVKATLASLGSLEEGRNKKRYVL